MKKITLIEKKDGLPGQISNKYITKCHFCQKAILINHNNNFLLKKLSGPKKTFCSFCLRNSFNTKKNQNIFILSFRNLIANLYYKDYLLLKNIWVSEIEEIIRSHETVGLKNPLFYYDSETFLWFVDFSRIGKTKKTCPIDEIKKNVVSILDCFSLNYSKKEILDSYLKGIELFYSKRYRPNKMMIFIPDIPNEYESDTEKYKNFLPKNLKKS